MENTLRGTNWSKVRIVTLYSLIYVKWVDRVGGGIFYKRGVYLGELIEAWGGRVPLLLVHPWSVLHT